MKKNSLIFSGLFLISTVFTLVFFISCEKENEIAENKQPQISLVQNYELPSELKVDLQKENGLIVFKDKQQFDKITNLLISETEKYIDSYFSKFDESLSVDEVNNQVDADEFNPNFVCESFEQFHSISSLRSKLNTIEDEWLDNEKLEGSNPAIYPISERCLSVANTNGEYQIGKTIYRVEQSGVVYEIKNQDYVALNNIRDAQMPVLKSANSNVIIYNADAVNSLKSTMSDCKAYIRKTDEAYSGDHRMDMIIDLDWDGYGSAAKAKTQAYRKKKKLFGGTKWGREWTSMSAQVHLVDFDINCNQQSTYDSGIKSRNWAYYVSVHVYETGMGLRSKSGGYFWGRHSTGSVSARYLSY